MAENTGQEKTEKATGKRRAEARKKGQVAQSKEVSSAMILMASLGFFNFAGSWMLWNLSDIITEVYHEVLDFTAGTPQPDDLTIVILKRKDASPQI